MNKELFPLDEVISTDPDAKVLGLDLSFTNSGWAMLANGITTFGSKSYPAPKKGRKNSPDEHDGLRFLNYSRWLSKLIRDNSPKLIAYEIPAGQHSSMQALYGLRGILFAIAAGQAVPIAGTYPSSLKLFFTGSGCASKEDMIAVCNDLNFDVRNSDEADAIALTIWGASLKKARLSAGIE
jgi:Holliday junction resolvasome RuvABC endonuclease subunit